MKAIGFEQPFKLSDGNLFKTFNLDIPEPKVHEILVKIQSISVNPVDTKQRLMDVSKAPRVLGFDAIGVVESVEMKLLCLIRVTLYITLVHLIKTDQMQNTN